MIFSCYHEDSRGPKHIEPSRDDGLQAQRDAVTGVTIPQMFIDGGAAGWNREADSAKQRLGRLRGNGAT